MNAEDPNTRRDGEEPSAPPALAAALKEPPARRVFVPPAIDAAVVNAARRHLAERPARPRSLFSWFAWPAFAAAGLVLIGLIAVLNRGEREPPEFAREDLNHDGRVDVLDAFQLARELRSSPKPGAGRDLNGDGVVDERDARWIAARAVKLDKGGRS